MEKVIKGSKDSGRYVIKAEGREAYEYFLDGDFENEFKTIEEAIKTFERDKDWDLLIDKLYEDIDKLSLENPEEFNGFKGYAFEIINECCRDINEDKIPDLEKYFNILKKASVKFVKQYTKYRS